MAGKKQSRAEPAVVIIGASIAGLSAALAFNRRGVPVTVIERDDVSNAQQPVNGLSHRRGVPHTMQPHFFLSGLRSAFKQWYPGLVEEMISAGVKEVAVEQCLPPPAKGHPHAHRSGDEDLTFLAARRHVLEEAMRRFAERQDGIEIRKSTKVLRLTSEDTVAPFRITGVEVEQNGEKRLIRAETIVDASGRTTKFLEPFLELGASYDDFCYKSKSAYYTRHYRLRSGQKLPDFVGMPSALFDDLVAVSFVADGDNFVMSIVVNQDDPILYNRAMTDPAVFEAILRRIPKVARWIETQRAEPISPVVGWANMDFFWRTVCPNKVPQLLGYFPVGDTVIRSNPKFGRGCTWGVIGADILAEVICNEQDQAEQILRYEDQLLERFRSDWDTMFAVDKEDQLRFETEIGLLPSTFKSRLISKIAHWTVNIAVSVDPIFYREVVRGFYGLSSPVAWAKKPMNWMRVLVANLVPSRSLKTARHYSARPSRADIQNIIQTLHTNSQN